MNIEMMMQVADAIEQENLAEFDMNVWIKEKLAYKDGRTVSCGTTACVAGTAVLLANKRLEAECGTARPEAMSSMLSRATRYAAVAAQILDLSHEEAEHLFGAGGEEARDRINGNKRVVPDALRWMAATGEVNWNKALKAARCAYFERMRPLKTRL